MRTFMDFAMEDAARTELLFVQMSNEPGGTHWTCHLNRFVDLCVDDAITRSTR